MIASPERRSYLAITKTERTWDANYSNRKGQKRKDKTKVKTEVVLADLLTQFSLEDQFGP